MECSLKFCLLQQNETAHCAHGSSLLHLDRRVESGDRSGDKHQSESFNTHRALKVTRDSAGVQQCSRKNHARPTMNRVIDHPMVLLAEKKRDIQVTSVTLSFKTSEVSGFRVLALQEKNTQGRLVVAEGNET